jgi:hypothetical protein
MEQVSVNIGEVKGYQMGIDFAKQEPPRITDIAAVRMALKEFKKEQGGFDTMALARRAREIAGRFITDGSVTRLARMHRLELPFICIHRLKGQYVFLDPQPQPAATYQPPAEKEE